MKLSVILGSVRVNLKWVYSTQIVLFRSTYILIFTAHHLKCNIDGLYCLNIYYNQLAVLKAPWSNRTGLVCDCLPSCTEIEISIKDDKHGWESFPTDGVL